MAKKRKNGDGTVRLRKDGRWEGRVVIGYDDSGYPQTKNVLLPRLNCRNVPLNFFIRPFPPLDFKQGRNHFIRKSVPNGLAGTPPTIV